MTDLPPASPPNGPSRMPDGDGGGRADAIADDLAEDALGRPDVGRATGDVISSPPGRRTGRWLAPVIAAFAVAGVVAGVLVAVRGGAQPPPVLRLVGGGIGSVAGTFDAPTAAFPPFGTRPIRVVGTLPSGPDRARVQTLSAGSAPEAQVVTLARALGLTGSPRRGPDGWMLRAGDRELDVADAPGWPWSLHPVLTGVTVAPPASCKPVAPPAVPGTRSHPSTGPSCPVGGLPPIPYRPGQPVEPPVGQLPSQPAAPGGNGAGANGGGVYAGGPAVELPPLPPVPAGGTGAAGYRGPDLPPSLPSGPPPDAAAAEAAAAAVLTQLGFSSAPPRTFSAGPVVTVLADPVVDGLPTDGFGTQLAYASPLRLVFGLGWLGRPVVGAEYPLMAARKALDTMPASGLYGGCGAPVSLCRLPAHVPCGRVAPARPCATMPPSAPLVVTGARLGLALRWDDHAQALLVPAWFFAVQGAGSPPVSIAVDPGYLAAPVAPVPGQGGGWLGPRPGLLQPGQVVPVPPPGIPLAPNGAVPTPAASPAAPQPPGLPVPTPARSTR